MSRSYSAMVRSEENIYIFGQTSDQVIHRYAVGDYDPAQWVEGLSLIHISHFCVILWKRM